MATVRCVMGSDLVTSLSRAAVPRTSIFLGLKALINLIATVNMSLIMFRGTMVHCSASMSFEIVERAAIGVNAAGNIVFVARSSDEVQSALKAYPTARQIDLGSKFIIPGFVDTHCHAPQYSFAGVGTGVPLLEWLSKFTFNYEARFKEAEFASRVYGAVVPQLLRQGSTTVSYFATIHLEATKILHEVCVNAGQRALIGKVCMDCNAPPTYIETSADEAVKGTVDFIDYCAKANGSDLVQPTVTPRFAVSCTGPLLKSLGEVAAKYNCHIQSHLCENKDEIAFVEQTLFPGKSYTQVYHEAGLLTKKTVMAHCVHMSDEDLALLKSTSTGIAHCPTSNLSMHSGLCQVKRALTAGVKVGLGTDVSGGYSPSILSTMRDALSVSSAIQARPLEEQDHNAALDYQQVFYLATLGGAEALGMEERIGNFAVGKAFDALIVDVLSHDNIDCFGIEEPLQLFEKFLYLGDDRNIEHVFVQGKRVHGSSMKPVYSL